MKYKSVIGLEVHIQLKTKSKMFSRCPSGNSLDPNSLTDSLVLGLPGSLPVLNFEAIKKTIKTGIIFGSKITKICHWDRKHYFYPDLPKGYQISQSNAPICLGGTIEIEMGGSTRNVMGSHRHVKLNRIHLEEDVGKLSHMNNQSLIDYNRAGNPLIEIVTEPDIFSVEEAFAFLKALRTCMIYNDISDCDMEKGQMRCDVNISINPENEKKLGTKIEVKNLNSISGVRNCINYEIQRQIRDLENNKKIMQETRQWDPNEKCTKLIRKKEKINDYRFFVDPDLMPILISDSMIEEIKKNISELPFEKQRRFIMQYGVPYTITSVLCTNKKLCDFYEKTIKKHNNPIIIANLIINNLIRELSSTEGKQSLCVDECLISPDNLAELVFLIDNKTISKEISKEIFIEMYKTGNSPSMIFKERFNKKEFSLNEIKDFCYESIKKNPKAVIEFQAGKINAINVLKGYVMKITNRNSNPILIEKILNEVLKN